MRVKRYVVNALPDALPMIRSELGKDAVILNTKEIYVGGFLGLFRKKKMEVIAAVESGAQPAKPPAVKPAAGAETERRTAPSPAAPAGHRPEPGFAERLEQAHAHAAALAATSEGKPGTAAAAAPSRQTAQLPDTPQAVKVKASAPPAPAAAAGGATQTDASSPQGRDEVIHEIKQMKELVLKLAKQQAGPVVPEAFASLHERLASQDVTPAIIERLLQAIEADPAYERQPDEASAWRIAGSVLNEWMAPFAAQGIQPTDRIVHFVGPTGVGKTTTIAKLAAEQTLKRNRKVGFITSDTYRIAAVDQLRTYANILNVPLEVVFSPAELLRAFKQLEERDLIFMDTAGRNFRNELYVSEVNSLLQSDSVSETYLVLSLTGKTKDMGVVAERFSKYGINKVIFTKYDETDTYGAVLNLALEHGMHTAYIACGQNVPDDIEPFRTDTFVKQLLGAEAHD